ncbi:murein L,D-transpeptidase catalytic domain family protein, partial [bacterium]|nr:murein L,D-transpeptidase catalytic domain family protein [bacterium]
EISAQNSVITSDKSQISALESAISSLNSQSSDDEQTKADISSKKAAAEAKLAEAKAKLQTDEQKLQTLEDEKTDLEGQLSTEKENLSTLETKKSEIEAKILANCSEETKTTMEKYNTARDAITTVKTEELEKAKATAATKQSELDEINAKIDTKKAEEIKGEYSVNSLDNPEQLFKTLGLDKQGLDYKVFQFAIEGYKNLEDKGNGILAIFNATGDKKCYIVDMKNQKFLYSTDVRLGSGGMGNSIQGANQEGSHATLSGFMKVGSPYSASGHFWQEGIRLIGLENGINDNAGSKGVVIHYVKSGQNTTWGCMGIPPVMKNGKVDHAASQQRNREYFPEGTIVFTYPGDSRVDQYRGLSGLY